MGQLHWGDEESYEEAPIVLPDDDMNRNDAASSGKGNDGALSSADDFEYDLRRSESSDSIDDWSISGMRSRMRRSTGDEPVKYPEGSLGAFSTPEDYEAHAGNVVPPREEKPTQPEYDDPILLFPPDEMDDDYYRSTYSGQKRGSVSSEESDIDDSVGISFSRYTAENKEGEFFFMPFLDIPDEPEYDDDKEEKEEDEGEEISFSFRKVDAEQVKKEKEFIFMPFLNVSDETPSDMEDADDEARRRRSAKGTIFDEGLYLIPLESEEEEEEPEEEEDHHDEDEDDSGIYVVSSVGGVVPKAPKVPTTGEKKTSLKSERIPKPPQKKKKPGSSKSKGGAPQKQQSKTKTKSDKNSAVEEQFRAAMRNVSPEIRAAVKNDPVQRAALEQAVRIALVQQAAQEAVEKATGRPVFGGSSAASGGKKRRPPRPPQQRQSASRAKSVNFSPFSLRTSYDDGGVSEFGAPANNSNSATEFGVTSQTGTAAAPAAAPAAASSPAPTTPTGLPDSNQDPVLALLNGTAPEAGSPDSAAQTARRSAYQSPAAVRAAMRTGLEFDAPQTAQPVTATGPKTVITAAERETQVKRSGCLIWMIIAFAVFFVGTIGVLVLPNLTMQSRFDKAVNLMDHGQYMQAIALFEEFDSGDTKFYEDCRENISECAYRQASQYFSEAKYYEAYNLLVDKAIFNEDTKELALRSNYLYAEQLYAEGDWKNASTAYNNLLNEQYEDSQEKFNICQYQIAEEKVQQGNFLQAYQDFLTLGNYSDSQLRAASMIYEAWNADTASVTSTQLNDAVQVLGVLGSAEAVEVMDKMHDRAGELYDAGELRIAFDAYDALGSHSDSAYRAAVAMYRIWQEDPTFGTLSQRERAMIALRNRIGEPEAENMLNSAGFNQVRLLGLWTDGDSRLTLKKVEGSPDQMVLNIDLASINDTRIQLETSDVGFDGNIVYRLVDPRDPNSQKVVFQISSFDSLVALDPGSFSFYCFLNNREYVMTPQ